MVYSNPSTMNPIFYSLLKINFFDSKEKSGSKNRFLCDIVAILKQLTKKTEEFMAGYDIAVQGGYCDPIIEEDLIETDKKCICSYLKFYDECEFCKEYPQYAAMYYYDKPRLGKFFEEKYIDNLMQIYYFGMFPTKLWRLFSPYRKLKKKYFKLQKKTSRDLFPEFVKELWNIVIDYANEGANGWFDRFRDVAGVRSLAVLALETIKRNNISVEYLPNHVIKKLTETVHGYAM